MVLRDRSREGAFLEMGYCGKFYERVMQGPKSWFYVGNGEESSLRKMLGMKICH